MQPSKAIRETPSPARAVNSLKVKRQPCTLRIGSLREIPSHIASNVIDGMMRTYRPETRPEPDKIQPKDKPKTTLNQNLTQPRSINRMRADVMRMPRTTLLTLPRARHFDFDSLCLEVPTNALKDSTPPARRLFFIGDIFLKRRISHDGILMTFNDGTHRRRENEF
jgi:hypothetical protein